MGCFLTCFGGSSSNRRKHSHNLPSNNNPDLGHRFKSVSAIAVAEKEDNSDKLIINTVPEFRVKLPEEQLSLTEQVKLPEEQLSLTKQGSKPEKQLSSGIRRKVTFDSNVKEYEHVFIDDAPGNVQDSEKGVNQNCTTPDKSSSLSESGSTVSSLGLYPQNHRYQNCRESDDEEESDYEVSDLDEDGHGKGDEEEAYDDDYHPRNEQEFSTGDSRTQCPATHEVNDGPHDPLSNGLSPVIKIKNAGLNHNARDRAGYVHSVLNPVENTTQWKSVKAKGAPPLKQHKENFQIDSKFDLFTMKAKTKLDEPKNNNEVAIDASLSNWLVSSQKTPTCKAIPIDLELISSGASESIHGSDSVRSQERPILGALTVEELKQLSASSTPRKSPSRSPDDKPIVGTVGVHWNDITPTEDSVSTSSTKGIPNTTSKYREDRRVNWHSTPFEKRLERALNSGVAEAYASHRAC